MAKHEISVFNVSFLDLLSGALGAVIILFIVVPKMNQQQAETIETLDSLNVQANQVRQMMQQLENSVDRRQYEQLQREMQRLQEAINRTEQAVNQLEAENRQLESDAEELQRQTRAARGGGGRGGEMFGISAEFSVLAKWPENLDVDLYLRNHADGSWCCYNSVNPGFAKYMSDITRRERQDDNSYEMIYQQNLQPGTFDVYLHLYSTAGAAKVSSFAVLFPYTPNEMKISFPETTVTHTAKPQGGGGFKLGTLIVTANRISLQ